ncbi:MAG: thermonuclease family protein [Dysgonamonadaceae bacterium]|jgi:endonuclease YncB( thermonuclease family)|nr:thermonuclease family protein [Dysgonamonadaceae bacterium]
MRNTYLLLLFAFVSMASCQNDGAGNSNVPTFSDNGDTYCSICEQGLCDYCVTVTGIIDGDTFRGLTKDNEEIKFRIYAIDAPEKAQAYGTRSRQYLSNLIFKQTVGIKIQKKSDQYGRPVAWVFTEDGRDVSAEMLKAGMAWHYKYFDKTKKYADLEAEARKAKVGLWADDNPVAPWDFKKNKG